MRVIHTSYGTTIVSPYQSRRELEPPQWVPWEAELRELLRRELGEPVAVALFHLLGRLEPDCLRLAQTLLTRNSATLALCQQGRHLLAFGKPLCFETSRSGKERQRRFTIRSVEAACIRAWALNGRKPRGWSSSANSRALAAIQRAYRSSRSRPNDWGKGVRPDFALLMTKELSDAICAARDSA